MEKMYIISPNVTHDDEQYLSHAGHTLSIFDTNDEKFYHFLKYQIAEAIDHYGVEKLILLAPKKGLKMKLKQDFPKLEITNKHKEK